MSWLQGPLLLAQFGGCLVQGSACAYCGASIIFAFRGDTEADVYLTRALYSLTFILSVALMGLRVFYSCRVGQSIEDELQNCKWVLHSRRACIITGPFSLGGANLPSILPSALSSAQAGNRGPPQAFLGLFRSPGLRFVQVPRGRPAPRVARADRARRLLCREQRRIHVHRRRRLHIPHRPHAVQDHHQLRRGKFELYKEKGFSLFMQFLTAALSELLSTLLASRLFIYFSVFYHRTLILASATLTTILIVVRIRSCS